MADMLAALINKMNPKEREIFVGLAKGMSRQEIARDLNLPEATVSKRIQRARETKEWQELGRTLYRHRR
jgi:RNA polymerase sigma factor (sigma-70 family)